MGNAGWRPNRLYLNDGAGGFTDASMNLPPNFENSTDAVFGDVDQDGDLDLVFASTDCPGGLGCGPGRNLLFLNDGAGNFSDGTAQLLPWPGTGNSVALADLDDDGDLDALFTHDFFGEGVDYYFLNDGTGVFTQAADRVDGRGRAATSLAIGDVDNDRDLDLVIAGVDWLDGSHQTELHLNLLRQLDAPAALRASATYSLDAYLRHGPSSLATFALPYLSFAPASILLEPFGTIGIEPSLAIALPFVAIPQPDGKGTLDLTIPGNPALVDQQIYAQALLVPYPLPERLSNVVVDVVRP